MILFTVFNTDTLPEEISIPVVDITIETNAEYTDIKNTAADLIQITKIISDHADKSDAIYYCMCSDKPINKSAKKGHFSNQQFRSALFETMFKKHNKPDFISKVIIINDPDSNNHYIHLMSHRDNEAIVEIAAKELAKLDK